MSEESKINRREYLKSASASAAIVGGIPTISTQSRGMTDDTVEMVVVMGSDGARITKEVDGEWYRYEQHVDDIVDDFRADYTTHPAVEAVGIGSGLKRIGGRSGGHLRVYVDPSKSLAGIPDVYENVPIEIVEHKQARRMSCKCNTGDHSIMSGAVTVEDDGDGGVHGTATCEVEKGGTYYMLTASHLFTCDNADISNQTAYQNGDSFGSIAEYNHNGDWALIERGSGKVDDYDNDIEDYAGILSGHVTYDGLKDHMGTDPDPALRNGVKTCKHSGKIKDRDFSHSFEGCNPQDVSGWILTNNHNEGGDSGSPVFDQYTYNGCYYIAIIGLLSGGQGDASAQCNSTKVGSEGIVSPAHEMYNSHSINFDPEFSQC